MPTTRSTKSTRTSSSTVHMTRWSAGFLKAPLSPRCLPRGHSSAQLQALGHAPWRCIVDVVGAAPELRACRVASSQSPPHSPFPDFPSIMCIGVQAEPFLKEVAQKNRLIYGNLQWFEHSGASMRRREQRKEDALCCRQSRESRMEGMRRPSAWADDVTVVLFQMQLARLAQMLSV